MNLAPINLLLKDTPYRALRLLGSGATSEVFEVEREFLKGRFALKLIRSEVAEAEHYVDRLMREARILGQLSHPNLVEVVDLQKAIDGRPYLVMDLLEGNSLESELQNQGRIPPKETVRWCLQVLDALVEVHPRGVIHRDIKPSNLFIVKTVKRKRLLKLLDFGLAALRRPSVTETEPLKDSGDFSTTTGALVGAPGYLSPEANDGRPLDVRSDVFSLGVTMYEMLTGELPYRHSLAPPPFPSKSNPVISPRLDAITRKALARNPAERYQSASEFRNSLRKVKVQDD